MYKCKCINILGITVDTIRKLFVINDGSSCVSITKHNLSESESAVFIKKKTCLC